MTELVYVSLIGVTLVSVIGLYVWTFAVYCRTQSQLGTIYEKVLNHCVAPGIHVNPKEPFQRVDVCDLKHQQIIDTLDELKSDTKSLLKAHKIEEDK